MKKNNNNLILFLFYIICLWNNFIHKKKYIFLNSVIYSNYYIFIYFAIFISQIMENDMKSELCSEIIDRSKLMKILYYIRKYQLYFNF